MLRMDPFPTNLFLSFSSLPLQAHAPNLYSTKQRKKCPRFCGSSSDSRAQILFLVHLTHHLPFGSQRKQILYINKTHIGFRPHILIFGGFLGSSSMDFLQSNNAHFIGIAVAVAAVGIGAAYLFLSKKSKGCLDPENFRDFKLVEKRQLSHNVAKFRFALPSQTSVLGLPIGQHISCRGKDSVGEEVVKPYTPTTLDSDVGYFELVIKMYPQGRMSHHFREMKVGDYLSVKGPKGRFKYQTGQVRAFGMLAGGSGITPMFQVARAILENPNDKTNVHLIYANVTFEDILVKEELDGLVKNYPGRFQVYYVLNQPPEVWNGGVGFVSKEMIQTHLPSPATDIQILRCGPPPMNKAMAAHLDELGYTKEMQFQF